MKSFFIKSLVFFGVILSFSSIVQAANDVLKQSRCASIDCATPTQLRRVSCILETVYFCQKAKGPVLYEVWIGGKVALTHTKIKNKCDTYRTCRSTIQRATKVVLCAQSSGGHVIATRSPLKDYRRSVRAPVNLGGAPRLSKKRE